jgi:hypothetical protein
MRRRRAALLLAALLAACAGPAPQTAPAVSVRLEFRCLWWSPDEMEGMDPEDPPPKRTEVRLTQWEYTDPIGVPHPDVVDVVAEVTNEGAEPLTDATVTGAASWREGPINDESRAAWASAADKPTRRLSVPGHATRAVRFPVDIATRMKGLDKKRAWPWTLRVDVSVTDATGSLLARAHAELPIEPGD